MLWPGQSNKHCVVCGPKRGLGWVDPNSLSPLQLALEFYLHSPQVHDASNFNEMVHKTTINSSLKGSLHVWVCYYPWGGGVLFCILLILTWLQTLLCAPNFRDNNRSTCLLDCLLVV